ncbi:hypothetical protein F4677DRAFT_251815 [Hypoxylon crocopeplum]|nr:hypothetical protein F4677DRAFT_251815 [Hypoxylon crocopeplum]
MIGSRTYDNEQGESLLPVNETESNSSDNIYQSNSKRQGIHAQLAPFISNTAVFHQLHCLHVIIVAYYEALESFPSTNLTDIPDFDNNTATRIAPFHIRTLKYWTTRRTLQMDGTNLSNIEIMNMFFRGRNSLPTRPTQELSCSFP